MEIIRQGTQKGKQLLVVELSIYHSVELKQRTLIIVLEYDGTEFHGWQLQPGKRTVQGELEEALVKLTGSPHRVVAAGRTDAGVHALEQVAHFKTRSNLEPFEFKGGLNALLPADMSVLNVREAPLNFDARRSAKGKIYRYLILNRKERPAIDRHRVWHIRELLNIEAMRVAGEHLVGEHDFRSFRGQRCSAKTTVRKIRRIEIKRERGNLITIEVEATAFLRQMVRAIVGTLVEVGRGRWEPERVAKALMARDRRLAGPTAPPHGLYLVKVLYDPPIFTEEEA